MRSPAPHPHGSSRSTLARWLSRRLPPDRDLERDELRLLAVRVGGADDLWARHIRFDKAERHFVQLYRDLHVDLWLICWTHQQDTGFHDHDVSSGAVHVSAGDLLEVRLEYDGRSLGRRTILHSQGSSFDFDASHVHSLGHPLGKPPAVSIHAYSPPLWRMGYYDTDDHGLLRRRSVTYAEETRPDPALAAGLGTGPGSM